MVPLRTLFEFPQSRDSSLKTFKDMWLNVFLFGLISSLCVHGISAAVAFSKLRKHQWGRAFPVLIIIVGFISPLTYGVITSATIAGIYKTAGFTMAPIYSLTWGLAQTATIIFISFTRLLFTL